MGYKWIEMSNHGFGMNVYWDAPYGSTSAYVYWDLDYNDYGRTFNLYQRGEGTRYNSGATVPFDEYCIYVYKNGSYAAQSEWFKIEADAPPTYTVSYNNGGRGTAPSSQSATSGSSITLRGKMSNVAGTSYTVSYNANGGSSTPSSSTSTYTYTHTKWAKGSTSGTQYNPSSSYTVTGNTTMYGIWSGSRAAVTLPAAITKGDSYYYYNVYYDVNGGNSATPANHALTRSHTNTFAGWNTAQDGSGTTYAAGASFTPSNATTLYAKWTAGSLTGSTTLASAATKNDTTQTGYTITFNANGGSCSTANLTATDTVKWTFNKWNTKADGTGTAYSAGASYSTDAHVTLYATWTSSVTKGSINLPTPTRTGYTFQGWATSSSATSGSTGSYTPDATRTLYAIWASQTYPVTYYANGHGTAPAAQTKTHDTALTLQAFIGNNTSTGYKVSYNANGGSSTPATSSATTLTHTQTNWNTNSNGTGTNYGSKASYTGNAALNLYAIWSTSSSAVTLASAITKASTSETGYKVTFNANGGSCSTTELTSTKTRSYSFNKWAAGSTSGTKYSAGASYTPTSDITMYATWTESVTNNSITLPTPTRTGYTFKGWSTSSSASSGSTGSYTPTAATTLYATWQINTWTVSYNANGYGTAPSSQTKTYGQALTLRSFIADQTATGYTVSFNANGGTYTPSSKTSTITKKQTYWNTNSSGTGTNYTSAGSYTNNSAATLYAIWSSSNGYVTLPAAISRNSTTETGYKVTFNANGGSCSTTELTATNTRSYAFSKWAQGSVSGTKYDAAASFTPTAATTMYATWTESVTNGSIDLPTASKSGYTFVGWSTSASATTGSTGTYTPSSNVTLYAVYTANGYTVTYNANGYGTAPANQTKTHGTNLTLQPFIADQSGPGYTVSFNSNGGDSTPSNLTSTVTKKQTNWNTNSNGTGTNYSSKGTYSADASTTLYAIWSTVNGSVTLPEAITRKTTSEVFGTIIYDANGGECSVKEEDQYIIKNYTFDKWAQGSASGTKYAAGASFTPAAATTMYAIWKESSGKTIVELPTPTRDGYTFKGWATSPTANSGVTGEYNPSQTNTTLYAIWGQNNSRIHYNNNGIDTLCDVYYNNNGVAVLCNVYFNNNGTAVKI